MPILSSIRSLFSTIQKTPSPTTASDSSQKKRKTDEAARAALDSSTPPRTPKRLTSSERTPSAPSSKDSQASTQSSSATASATATTTPAPTQTAAPSASPAADSQAPAQSASPAPSPSETATTPPADSTQIPAPSPAISSQAPSPLSAPAPSTTATTPPVTPTQIPTPSPAISSQAPSLLPVPAPSTTATTPPVTPTQIPAPISSSAAKIRALAQSSSAAATASTATVVVVSPTPPATPTTQGVIKSVFEFFKSLLFSSTVQPKTEEEIYNTLALFEQKKSALLQSIESLLLKLKHQQREQLPPVLASYLKDISIQWENLRKLTAQGLAACRDLKGLTLSNGKKLEEVLAPQDRDGSRTIQALKEPKKEVPTDDILKVLKYYQSKNGFNYFRSKATEDLKGTLNLLMERTLPIEEAPQIVAKTDISFVNLPLREPSVSIRNIPSQLTELYQNGTLFSPTLDKVRAAALILVTALVYYRIDPNLEALKAGGSGMKWLGSKFIEWIKTPSDWTGKDYLSAVGLSGVALLIPKAYNIENKNVRMSSLAALAAAGGILYFT